MSELDTATQSVAPSESVAPSPTGEEANTPASTTGPVDTAAGEQDAQPKPEEAERKRNRSAEKRISKLSHRLDEANREIGYWRGIAEGRSSPQQGQNGEGEAPQERQLTPEQRAELEAHAELTDSALERLEEAGKDIEDFDEVLEKLTSRKFPGTRAIRDYFVIADHPAQLAQYLVEHVEEARKYSRMTEAVATRALEKLDARLKPEAKPDRKATPAVSRAPAPVPQVGGGGAASVDVERMDHESLKELVAKWSRD